LKPDLYIAKRYLSARKSLGVIHTISAISAIGMAVGTAALILILSVFNGFDRVIKENLSDLSPDILVTAAHGKYFIPEGPAFDALLDDPDILQACSVLEEQVFVSYSGREALARAKGVDEVYEEESRIAEHTLEGTFSLHLGDVPQAALGSGLAYKLGVRPFFTDPLVLYYPRRGARIPLAGPTAALGSVKLSPSCLLSLGASVDEELIVLPIAQMRNLLGLSEEVSGVELRISGKADRKIVRRLQELLGPDYLVRDRYQQNPALYKMMRYEKLAVYLILLFVVIIIATNIFGSLSMLSIEKQDDMQTLRALGANDRLVRRIFIWEGWLVSLCGLLAGLAVGIGLALLQQRFGIVKMPGGFLLQAYPVVLKASDVLWTVIGVGSIGLLISLLAAPAQDRQ
jgi:ABC-type lipoprotein release transport system permease subunit